MGKAVNTMTLLKNSIRLLTPAAFLLFLLLGAISWTGMAASASVLPVVSAAATNTPITGTQWTPPSPAYRVIIGPDMLGNANSSTEAVLGLKDGIYQLTYAYLSAAGLPVASIDPASLRMFWMGEEIAIEWDGDGDTLFEAGERILFYARTVDSLYADNLLPETRYEGENVYWLSYAGINGKRMTPKSGTVAGTETPVTTYMHTVRNENDVAYFNKRPWHPELPMPAKFQPGADRWLQRDLSGGWPFILSTANLPSSGPAGQLKFQFMGDSGVPSYSGLADTPHQVRISIGQNFGTFCFAGTCPVIYPTQVAGYGFEQFTVTATVPFGTLAPGTNIVFPELVPTGASSKIWVNWYEITYADSLVAEGDRLFFGGQSGVGPWRYTVSGFSNPGIRVYDVTDHSNPQNISNGSLTPSSVEFADGAADRRYFAVSESGLFTPLRMEEVNYLSSAYTPADLLNVTMGADWIAITPREFFTETVRLATYRSTKYRVKVVDAQQIYDQFNGGLLSPESIREFLRYTYYNWPGPAPELVLLVGDGTRDPRKFASSDTTFIPPFMTVADPIEGETAADNRFVTFIGNDILPDMSIGRFPVDTLAEATLMVSKTIDYEKTPTFNDWNLRVLLISDDEAGGGGDFYEFNNILADGYENPNFPTPETKFLPEPYTSTKIYLDSTCTLGDCRQQIVDGVNEGALFTSYVGHAQQFNWAVEPLVDGSTVPQWTNYNKLSIFLGMACFEGFFHQPGIIPLAEQYLLSPVGGAVASWSPAGFGVATGHDWLEKGLFLSVFQDKEPTLGKATTAGKYYLANNAPAGKYDDLIDTHILFGDPALHIQGYINPTAVDMADMDAQATDGQIDVQWRTGSEVEIAGFNVLRGVSQSGPFEKINGDVIPARHAGTADGTSYHFLDAGVAVGEGYWYRLEVLKLDGSKEPYGLVFAGLRVQNNIFLPAVIR